MKRVKLLDKNLINQIAAGEVIERPASVVKELVENSNDAGSNKIEIEISNECRDIRVSDNGSGIHKEDITLAFSRHATSKIQTQNDLWDISTLGFRGEALASIISISEVICTTKTKDDELGIKAHCKESEVEYNEVGCAIGTTMDVKKLFYNTPARLKFLKKPKTEFAYILEILQAIAIANPHVSFSVIHNGAKSFNTSGSDDFATVISEIYSKDLIRELEEIKKCDELSDIKITGLTSNPDFTRSNRKAIYTFINGRNVKCPIILKAIDTAYKDMIPKGKYPFCVVNLELPAKDVDVNVHPSKKEVRYTQTNQIFSFVHSAFKYALADKFVATSISNEKPENNYIPSFENTLPDKEIALKAIDFYSPVNFDEMKQSASSSTATINKQEEVEQIEFLPKEEIKKDEDIIIGQIFDSYILIQTKEGLQLIDQHIAEERYYYDKLKEEQIINSQTLFASSIIELEPSEITLIEEHKSTLDKFGYEIHKVSDNEVIFKKVPTVIASKEPEQIISELLEGLNSTLEQIEDKILATTACKASIKAGEKLNIWQMEEVIKKWKSSTYPKTCPHGRKIAHIIDKKEIAGFFGRIE